MFQCFKIGLVIESGRQLDILVIEKLNSNADYQRCINITKWQLGINIYCNGKYKIETLDTKLGIKFVNALERVDVVVRNKNMPLPPSTLWLYSVLERRPMVAHNLAIFLHSILLFKAPSTLTVIFKNIVKYALFYDV